MRPPPAVGGRSLSRALVAPRRGGGAVLVREVRVPGLLEESLELLLGLVLRVAVPLLQQAGQLVEASLRLVQLVVRELAPLLLHAALDLLPLAFEDVPVHIALLARKGEQYPCKAPAAPQMRARTSFARGGGQRAPARAGMEGGSPPGRAPSRGVTPSGVVPRPAETAGHRWWAWMGPALSKNSGNILIPPAGGGQYPRRRA